MAVLALAAEADVVIAVGSVVLNFVGAAVLTSTAVVVDDVWYLVDCGYGAGRQANRAGLPMADLRLGQPGGHVIE